MAGRMARQVLRSGFLLRPSTSAAAPAAVQLPSLRDAPKDLPPDLRAPLAIHVPNLDSAVREILDPAYAPAGPLLDPPSTRETPMEAVWIKNVKHRKVRIHKQKKRWRQNRYMYMERYKAHLLSEERRFEGEMNGLLEQLNKFQPQEFVKDTIRKAKWAPPEVRPSGGRAYPHWSTLMSVEELYGLPKDDRIDKAAGKPSDEDWAEILRLRKEYYAKFRGIDIEKEEKFKN